MPPRDPIVIHASEMATVWVVRAGERNRLLQTFLDDGTVGLDHRGLPDGRTLDRTTTLRLLQPDRDAPAPEAEAAMFLSFVRRMEIGDLVLVPDHAAKGFPVGVVAGDYEYHDDTDARRPQHRRPVEWRRRLPFDALPERLVQLPNQRQRIHDVPDGRLRDLALRCSRLEFGEDPFDRPRGAAASARTSSPRRPRAPKRPPQATIPERRCANCFVSKPADLFDEDSEWCRDCM